MKQAALVDKREQFKHIEIVKDYFSGKNKYFWDGKEL